MRWVFVSALLFALSWLTFGISPASALMQATETPTPGWEPLFPSSTAVPTMNYTCPTELPAGWGAVTPGVNWNINCSNCLYTLTPPAATQTPFITWPTATPDPVQPTATPTQEVDEFNLIFVPNPDPDEHLTQGYPGSDGFQEQMNVAPEHADRVIGFVMEFDRIGPYQAGMSHLFHTFSGEGDTDYAGGAGYYIFGQAKSDIKLFHDNLTWLHPNNGNHPYWAELQAAEADWDQHWTEFMTYYLSDILSMSQYGVAAMQRVESGTAHVWYEGQGDNLWLRWNFYAGHYVTSNGLARILGYVVFNPGAGGDPPPVAGYCGSVDPGFAGGGGSGVPDLGISLPVVAKGPAQCSGLGSVGPVDLPLVGEVSFPGIQVCFEPISIGNLEMFGLEINLDYMIFVLGCIMIIRWFLRS